MLCVCAHTRVQIELDNYHNIPIYALFHVILLTVYCFNVEAHLSIYKFATFNYEGVINFYCYLQTKFWSMSMCIHTTKNVQQICRI